MRISDWSSDVCSSDLVVVVEHVELAQLQVSGERRGFGGDAFHQVAIAGDHPGAVIDDDVPGAVVPRGQLRLGHGHAHGVGEALSQRSGGDLDARGMAALGMPRRLRSEEHKYELQSLMRISSAGVCLK